MNELNINEELNIFNIRVTNMLNTKEVNSEVFYRDVRALTELVGYILENEDTDELWRLVVNPCKMCTSRLSK
jgi:hypothetical protein